MSATKSFEITLPIDLAREVEARVASGEYESVSDLVRDNLEEPVGSDPEIERWLRDEVVPTIDALRDGRSKTLSLEEVRNRIDSFITDRDAETEDAP